jgi:outer membrane usher protein
MSFHMIRRARLLPAALALALADIAVAQALPPPDAAVAGVPLILEVRVNGQLVPGLWQFQLLPDGGLSASSVQLRALGLRLPPGDAPTRLSALPGVRYHYVEATQSLEIDAADDALVPVVLDSRSAPVPLDVDRIETNRAALLNYGVYASASDAEVLASLQYEARLLGQWGSFSTSGFTTWASSGQGRVAHRRLDSFWRLVDARRVMVLTVGDAIGDGGQLGSAYRLGGIQLRRDFGNRPDLVTMALPIVSGSAAVPSVLDLYVNGMRYFSGEVGRGPFQFRSLPNFGGGVNATIVMTDAAGRETRISQPIFFVPGLLPPGLMDFSVEAGFPRLDYGVDSFNYLGDPAASGTVRYGVSQSLTAMGHVEAMPGLANGSVGATLRIGGLGSLTAGVAASRFEGAFGTRWSLEGQTRLRGINLFAAIERSHSDYQDIVTATWVKSGRLEDRALIPGGRPGEPILEAYSRKTERAGASFSLGSVGVNLGYTRLRLPSQNLRITSASLHRTLFGRLSIWANGYSNHGDRDDFGLFLGFNLALRGGTSLSSSLASRQGGATLSTRLTHDPGLQEGAVSWSLASNDPLSGDEPTARAADIRYLGHDATLGAGVAHFDGRFRATGFVEGSVVLMGGLFLSPRIDSSFAVVTGAGANTPVYANTRRVAHSDARGRALVPSLNSLQLNHVSIDPSNLEVDLRPDRTQAEVIPADRGGVVVDFGVRPVAAAIVILVDASGKPLPVGALALREGSDEAVVVGYDGRVYLSGLAAHNRVRVQRPGLPDCAASFDFAPVAGQQILIGPLECQ